MGEHHFIQGMEVVFQDLDANQLTNKSNLNPWLAFECLLQHMEDEALEIYQSWSKWHIVHAKL
jgi:hypothetical protein